MKKNRIAENLYSTVPLEKKRDQESIIELETLHSILQVMLKRIEDLENTRNQ
jgi:hypothetical protein